LRENAFSAGYQDGYPCAGVHKELAARVHCTGDPPPPAPGVAPRCGIVEEFQVRNASFLFLFSRFLMRNTIICQFRLRTNSRKTHQDTHKRTAFHTVAQSRLSHWEDDRQCHHGIVRHALGLLCERRVQTIHVVRLRAVCGGTETSFCAIFARNTEDLPRQARDKHRKLVRIRKERGYVT
jgi:hypothetical protein